MAKIKGVWMNDNGSLDIYLSNCHGIWYPLGGRLILLRLICKLTGADNYNPKTDGTRVYWKSGLSLSLCKILKTVEG